MRIFGSEISLFLRHAASVALLILMVIAPATLVRAQSNATLRGTVTDETGASVPKAKIVIHNQDTGVDWNTVSDEEGNYQVPGLPVGTYRVEVSAQGFQTVIFTDLRLDVSSKVVKNVQLKVGATTQQVTITAEAPVIQAGSITVGQTINQRTVQDIPLNGRHFVDLTLLTPGTVMPPANGFLTAPLRGQGAFGVNTAGQREDTVNYMINGINLNDEVQNQITFQPSINTVQEFRIDNSTFSAEYGRNSGSIINIATRNGTNQFHGEAFEYHRNNALDARNFFNSKTLSSGAANPQSPFIRNSFGADAGGPIVRDKAFFYASYEGLRQRQGLSLSTNVPSDAQRAAVVDPVVLKLLPLIQHSNTTIGGLPFFVGSATAPVNIDQGTGDLQFNLGPNDRLHGYLAIQQDLRQEPTIQGNTLPGWGDTRASRRQIMTINEDHVFGPNLTNEVRLGYNRIHILFSPNQPLNPADFGIVNGITGPIGLPQIIIGAVGTAGALDIGGPAGFPQGRGDATVVLSDTLHWLRGRHAFAIGGEMRRFYNNNVAQNIGSYTFATLQNFLNDQSNRFNVTIGSGNDKILEPAWGMFVQDNFKMTPNFTLELGLRYDYNSTPTDGNGLFSVFVPSTVSLVQVGTNGVSQVYHTNNKNIQPRLGFAWNPFHNDKTVVRAAYAILTDQPVTNAVTPLSSNPPFALPVTTTSATNAISFLNTGAATAGSIGPATISPTFDNPYVQSWNLNVQRQVTPSLGLMAGYFGSKGTHLRILLNENQKGNAATVPFPALSASSPILPGKTLSNINEVDSSSNSNYNALWVTLTKHVTHGLQFNASYTYSHSLDENSLTSSGVTVQDSFNIRNDYGSSDFDVRHRIVFSGIYDLPFKGNRLFEGWELGIITQAQSGNPLNIITSNTAFTGNQTVRPDVSGPIVTTGNPAQWFANPAVFVVTAPVHFGNLGRNAALGPDFVNTDFSLIKTTKITETTKVQFRAEMFDIFNHPNFGNPGRIAGSSTFGQITSTRVPTGDFGSSRQIQLALKFQF
jgi:hypothetical protein